jgi:hypothetical protein
MKRYIKSNKGVAPTVGKKRRAVKAAYTATPMDNGIIRILLDNGFEPAGGWIGGTPQFSDDEPWLDKWLWLGFGCTYNTNTGEAYMWWNPDGNQVDLPYEWNIVTTADANTLCDQLYDWDEYNIDELLAVGLPLIGAVETEPNHFRYEDGGLVAEIDLDLSRGTVTDDYGTESYSNLQDLLEHADIIG